MNDNAIGCIIGALVGDALGGQVEFIKRRPIPHELISSADSMEGGGFLDLAPGQITDDGELTLCCLQSLLSNENALVWYNRWYASDPCDVGRTCAGAFRNDAIVDDETQANGALMRCTPIGAFVHPQEVAKYAMQDATLSHASVVCIQANIAYCKAISHLVHYGGIDDALKIAKETCTNMDILQWIDDPDPYEVMKELMNQTNIGWVRWGFSLAFYHLRMRSKFEEALLSVIRAGGDTDTNACIVGGMLGAQVGIRAIPQKWVKPVMTCNVRPLWLQPGHVFKTIDTIMESRIRDIAFNPEMMQGNGLVEQWASNLYSRINFIMRNYPIEIQYSETPRLFQFVQEFIKHIKSHGLYRRDIEKRSKYLFRGLNGEFIPEQVHDEKGFMSTTLSKSVACSFSNSSLVCGSLQIFKVKHLPEDVPFLLIDESINRIFHEDEILMLPGKVTVIRKSESNKEKKEYVSYECNINLVNAYLTKPPPILQGVYMSAHTHVSTDLCNKTILLYRGVIGYDIEIIGKIHGPKKKHVQEFMRNRWRSIIRYYDGVTDLIPEVRRLKQYVKTETDISKLRIALRTMTSYNIHFATYDHKTAAICIHPMIPRGMFEELFDITRETEVIRAIEKYMKT
jgi:ADP-ribosylglycohydrolase